MTDPSDAEPVDDTRIVLWFEVDRSSADTPHDITNNVKDPMRIVSSRMLRFFCIITDHHQLIDSGTDSSTSSSISNRKGAYSFAYGSGVY